MKLLDYTLVSLLASLPPLVCAQSADSTPAEQGQTETVAPPAKATALGKFSITLPDGGVIWATEDPNLS